MKERKQNRLKEYDYSASGRYFITICTKDRKNLLSTIVGGGALDAPRIRLTALGEMTEKYIRSSERIEGITVEKFVIMPNHIHLLVRLNREGTPRAASPTECAIIPRKVGVLKRLIHKEAGVALFQRSFYDHIIRDERDYLAVWEYIENNPAKWVEDRYYNE